jgi:hypothetical protein
LPPSASGAISSSLLPIRRFSIWHLLDRHGQNALFVEAFSISL